MILSDQKKKEYAHLLAFKESIPDFPKGQIALDGEHPDFLIHATTGIIGIEHTEVYHKPRKDGSSLQATETYVHQILRRAKEIHDDQGGEPALVWLNLTRQARLNKAKVEALATALADIVQMRMPPNQESTKIRQTWNTKSELPEEFSSVTIFRIDNLKDPVWAPVMASAIPDIPSDFVQERINHKNEKVVKYRKRCDEVWLLIVVYGFLPSTWFDVSGEALKELYQSDFDRTYLFDFQKGNTIRLITEAPKSQQRV